MATIESRLREMALMLSMEGHPDGSTFASDVALAKEAARHIENLEQKVKTLEDMVALLNAEESDG